ncbi:MAG TPA: tripartite tricarboxylate transporter substrate-binding protein [Burkholderiales bacterium]|jgi:tripartite-type tricarboxylate transporter receptor subunit TctC|nr:tripartite tricarboxylate transporter substrate-binding protein [Burkholderiales bacterium]
MRNAGRGFAALVMALAAGAAAAQEKFPSRPIHLVVSFTPGGGADFTARTVAQKMGDILGQLVVVENKPGANGLVGCEAVAKAAPDGYTLLETDRGALGVNPSLYKKLPYDPLTDFEYVGVVTTAPYVLVSNPRLAAKTLAELAALAKAKPGALNYGSYGIGSMAQLNIEALKAKLGIDLTHVPYKGAGPAVQAVVAGEAAATIASPAAVLGFIRDGRLRALAIGTKRRTPLLPDAPTLAEAGAQFGLDEDTLASTYFAFALPAKTPRAIVRGMSEVMRRSVMSPDVVERLAVAGLEPTGGTGPELLELVKRDIPRFRGIIQNIGIQPE